MDNQGKNGETFIPRISDRGPGGLLAEREVAKERRNNHKSQVWTSRG